MQVSADNNVECVINSLMAICIMTDDDFLLKKKTEYQLQRKNE